MKHPVESLQRRLGDIVALLDEGAFYSLAAPQVESLRKEGLDLAQQLASIEDDLLTIGLLGGTGVGKSTLMNALAGEEIASTSHRRPHTDHILVYKHAKAPSLSSKTVTEIPCNELTHEVRSIEHILLCDLPDFDSLMGDHRTRVIEFLKHLDLLVWVTSPEKYADGRFYEFLALVPKAEQNFYFVLNKTDLLFGDKTKGKAFEDLSSITKRFQQHIKQAGIDEPLFWTVSTQEAVHARELAPWNQFPALRQQIFLQRDVKHITAIKTANLDVEVQHLFSAFNKEAIDLKSFLGLLRTFVDELKEQPSPWRQSGHMAIDMWLKNHVMSYCLSPRNAPLPLVGPGHAVGSLVRSLSRPFSEKKALPQQHDPVPDVLPEDVSVSLRRHFEWVKDRCHRRILSHNLPASFQAQINAILDVSERFSELEQNLTSIASAHIVSPATPSFRGFKVLQFIAYGLVTAFFLLAIGEHAAWTKLLDAPGWTKGLGLLVSMIHTLFSPKGLAALGSYTLLNLLFAVGFYRRYNNLMKRFAEKSIQSLLVKLEQILDDQRNDMLDDLNDLATRIQSRLVYIENLQKTRKGGDSAYKP